MCTFLVAGAILGTVSTRADGMLFDFGADETPTVGGPAGDPMTWNNVTGIGLDDFGFLDSLVTTDGTPTVVYLQMVSRFNGVNENGTTLVTIYPPSATRDSLFGNTELFSGLENITPIFKLGGLTQGATYSLRFYASRTGVADNRETRYTVTGATETFADLDVANNQTNTVTVAGMAPDGLGEITIALTPGPNNNNGNHFTYLGVLEVESSTGEHFLLDFGGGGSPTDIVEPPNSSAWNNVTPLIGADDVGTLPNLVTTNGTQTGMHLQMVSRFNGQNSNGSTVATVFPVTATQDSLFGNTEVFSGVSNIFPAFKLTGLDPNYLFSFTFYASRTGVTDNRQTRYTVTGSTSRSAFLNASNNTNETATVTDIVPDANGEITIELAPGAENNNANHFTYLGVMKVDFAPVRTPRLLIDFGGANTTELGQDDPDNTWNNVTTAVGTTDTGVLPNLVKTDGSATSINLEMVSRFNGANENGTQVHPELPIDATRDSLFGNTEVFNDLENVTPIFKLTGLDPATPYTFSFYASRLGVGDNRQTRYTVTGLTEQSTELNVANNETAVAVLENVMPDATGEITIALTPGVENDNANHFTYLGILQVDWPAPAPGEAPRLSQTTYDDGQINFTLTGVSGTTYRIQRTADFATWEEVQTVTLSSPAERFQFNAPARFGFYRAVVD